MAYKLLQPIMSFDFSQANKKTLKQYHDWFMSVMPERLEELTRAVRSDLQFYDWQPDGTPDSLGPLGHWFAKRVGVRPRTEEEMREVQAESVMPFLVSNRDLTNETYSLAFDVGLYLGTVIRNQYPELQWTQIVKGPRKDVDFGYVVLDGLGPVPFNPVWMCVGFAWGIIHGTRNADGLRELFDIWAKTWDEARAMGK